MGEYECVDCNEMFWADEPAEDIDRCDECRKAHRKASSIYHNVMLRDYPEKLIGRK